MVDAVCVHVYLLRPPAAGMDETVVVAVAAPVGVMLLLGCVVCAAKRRNRRGGEAASASNKAEGENERAGHDMHRYMTTRTRRCAVLLREDDDVLRSHEHGMTTTHRMDAVPS